MEIVETEVITEYKNNFLDKIREILSLEMNQCIQCGTCSAVCPSGARTALTTRKLIRRIILGDDSVLRDPDLWLCTTCFSCIEKCPRGVPIVDIITFLRNLAVKEGHIKSAHRGLCENLTSTGHGVPIDDEKWIKLRKFYHLKGIPKTVQSDLEKVEEVRYLLKCTSFKDIIDIDKNPAEAIEEKEEDVLEQWQKT